jgi:hypothetical protein
MFTVVSQGIRLSDIRERPLFGHRLLYRRPGMSDYRDQLSICELGKRADVLARSGGRVGDHALLSPVP